MIAAIAAVLAAAVLAVLGWLIIHRATRLERLLEAHNRDEADLEALADATREPPQWSDEEIDRLREVMRKDGEGP